MNLNDIRANAYKNGARKGERSSDESAMKAAGERPPSDEDSVRARLSRSINGGSNKPFEGVNRKIATIFSASKTLSKQAALQNARSGNEGLSRAADTLKKGAVTRKHPTASRIA